MPQTLNNKHLRYVIVAFAFSAAIADTGRSATEVFSDPRHCLSGSSHLVLAFFAITMSWVYWARSIRDDSEALESVFSRQYLLLLFDLILVTIYIALVKTAELPDREHHQCDKNGQPSVLPESTLLALVYVLYVIWDFFHDILSKQCNTQQLFLHASGSNQWAASPTVAQTLKAIRVRCGASLASLALSLLVLALAYWLRINTWLGVVALNVAELANLVMFRAFKVYEFGADASLHPMYREHSDRHTSFRALMTIWLFIALGAYLIAAGGVLCWGIASMVGS